MSSFYIASDHSLVLFSGKQVQRKMTPSWIIGVMAFITGVSIGRVCAIDYTVLTILIVLAMCNSSLCDKCQ